MRKIEDQKYESEFKIGIPRSAILIWVISTLENTLRKCTARLVCIAKSLLTKHLKTSRSLLKKEARRDGTTLPLFSSSFFSRNEWVETIWHYGFNYAVTFSKLVTTEERTYKYYTILKTAIWKIKCLTILTAREESIWVFCQEFLFGLRFSDRSTATLSSTTALADICIKEQAKLQT